MRHFRRILLAVLCLFALATAASAESSATSVNFQCTVSSSGSCDVTLTVTLNLEEAASGLTFPLPKGATNVSVNGVSVRTYASSVDENVILADLSSLDGIIGSYSLTFQYGISDVTKTENNKLYMELPLLCGFDYPVDVMSFRIIMPGDVTGEPSFTSGYLQTGIESVVQCAVGGSLISGSVTQALSGYETLTLTMAVSESLFPGKLTTEREGNPETVPMGVCAALAVLYWLVFMRCLPLMRSRQTTVPDGMTAGELGCRLTMAGVDLTTMVLSWASLGYVLIVPDAYGRVLLYKRMEMGNERTDFEVRSFRRLFGRGNRTDASGTRYAELCRETAETVTGVREMHRRSAGSARLFRGLASGVSLFSGVCFAMNLTANTVLQVILAIVLALLGVVTAWGIQGGMYRLHLRGKTPVLICIICAVLWLALGLLAGQWAVALWAIAAQLAAGLLAAYGGRRSELGRSQTGQILGLRSYMTRMTREELTRSLDNDPYYFFNLLPYAVALGVEGRFARRFGKTRMPECGYLLPSQHRSRSAEEWAVLVRRTADRMDAIQRREELRTWIPLVPGRRPSRVPVSQKTRRSSARRGKKPAARPAQGRTPHRKRRPREK